MGVKDNKNNINNKNNKNNHYQKNPLLITQPILLLQKNHHLNIILNKEWKIKRINNISNSNKMTKINKLLNFNNNNSWNHAPSAVESSIQTRIKNTSKFVKRCFIKRENNLVVKSKGVLVTKGSDH